MSDYNIELICTVTDPDERRRRIAHAYDILLGVANRTRQPPASQHDETMEALPPVDDDTHDSEH